jgi:hypothetical protein
LQLDILESTEEDESDTDESDLVLTDILEGPPYDESQQMYEEAFRRNPLDLVRRIIRRIRASNQRWEFLKQLISDGNKNRRFKDAAGNVIEVPLLQLLLDVKTCWDSTYLMIKRFLNAHPVCQIFFLH